MLCVNATCAQAELSYDFHAETEAQCEAVGYAWLKKAFREGDRYKLHEWGCKPQRWGASRRDS